MRDGDWGQFVICPSSPCLSLSAGAESNRFGTETRAATPERRTPSENCGFNANSRERSLSTFCVNWLTGSFRAKILSSPEGTLFMTPPKLSRPFLPMNYEYFKFAADWQRHRLHPQTRRHHPFLLPPSRIKSPRPSSHSELDCAQRPRRLRFSTAIRLRNLISTRLTPPQTVDLKLIIPRY